MTKERCKLGTLVRVREESCAGPSAHWHSNLKLVAEHGYLWTVQSFESDAQWYLCKSIATGQTGVAWLPSEIEGADNHE